MKRATITAISLLLITLAGYAQASGETSEWEKFRKWEDDTTQREYKTEEKKPMPAICRNIEKHHPDKQKRIENLCDKIPLARVYGKLGGTWFYGKGIEKRTGHYCINLDEEIAETAREIASSGFASIPQNELHQKLAFCEQAFRIRVLFEWLRKNK